MERKRTFLVFVFVNDSVLSLPHTFTCSLFHTLNVPVTDGLSHRPLDSLPSATQKPPTNFPHQFWTKGDVEGQRRLAHESRAVFLEITGIVR